MFRAQAMTRLSVRCRGIIDSAGASSARLGTDSLAPHPTHVFFKAGYRLVQSGKTSQKRWQAVHRSNNNIRSRTCTYNFNHNHSD